MAMVAAPASQYQKLKCSLKVIPCVRITREILSAKGNTNYSLQKGGFGGRFIFLCCVVSQQSLWRWNLALFWCPTGEVCLHVPSDKRHRHMQAQRMQLPSLISDRKGTTAAQGQARHSGSLTSPILSAIPCFDRSPLSSSLLLVVSWRAWLS